jgi:RNA polymerase sigma factor for flagellar operon FliA
VTAQEVAAEVDIDEHEVAAIQSESFFANVLSMDEEPGREDGPATILIEDKKARLPEKELLKDETIRHLTEMIHMLNEKEQLVVSLFYYEELTLTEIGKVLELSTSRISQIHSKALFRLQQAFKEADVHKSDWYEEG